MTSSDYKFLDFGIKKTVITMTAFALGKTMFARHPLWPVVTQT